MPQNSDGIGRKYIHVLSSVFARITCSKKNLMTFIKEKCTEYNVPRIDEGIDSGSLRVQIRPDVDAQASFSSTFLLLFLLLLFLLFVVSLFNSLLPVDPADSYQTQHTLIPKTLSQFKATSVRASHNELQVLCCYSILVMYSNRIRLVIKRIECSIQQGC